MKALIKILSTAATVVLCIPSIVGATSEPTKTAYHCMISKVPIEAWVVHSQPKVFHISTTIDPVLDGEDGFIDFDPDYLTVRYLPKEAETSWLFHLNRVTGDMTLRTYNNHNVLTSTQVGVCKRQKT